MEIYRNEPATLTLTNGTQAIGGLSVTGTDGQLYTVATQKTIIVPSAAAGYDGGIRVS